jgi:hypothetical protein
MKVNLIDKGSLSNAVSAEAERADDNTIIDFEACPKVRLPVDSTFYLPN